MKILFIDIETTPLTAHTWGLWQQNVSIGQLLQSTEMLCFGAAWYGQKRITFRSVHHHGKEKMLNDLWDLMDEADVICGWNSKSFDHKHISREFVEAGMPPPSPSRDMDLMLTARSRFRFPSNKLDYVAQRLVGKAKVKHAGFELWVGCMAGRAKDWAEMRRYQIQDVQLLLDLYEILKPWIPNHPNMVRDPEAIECVVCNSTRLTRRGTLRTNAMVYQRYQCQDCGKWAKGKTGKSISMTRGV